MGLSPFGGPEPYWWAGALLVGRGHIGGAERTYTTLRWNTDTKATSEQIVSERLLSQWSTATIPHHEFAHVLLAKPPGSQEFLISVCAKGGGGGQSKTKPECSQTN